jgi:hypothetical protein
MHLFSLFFLTPDSPCREIATLPRWKHWTLSSEDWPKGKGVAMKKFGLLAAVGCVLMATAAQAQVLMDQIGTVPYTATPQVRASQRFEAANSPAFDVGVGDDFVVPAGSSRQVTLVEALVSGFNGFTAAHFTDGAIQSYAVEIYSSQAAAAANLNGDVAHVVFPAASAVLTPFGPDPQRLVAFNLTSSGVNLAPGTYFLAVIPRMDFANNGQTGIADSPFAGADPGGLNGFQNNPAGGFGQGAIVNTAQNESYRLTVAAVPEPTSIALVGIGLAGFGWRRFRKR